MPSDHRSFDAFIGIALGGGRGKNTAVAQLRRCADGVRVVFVNTKTPEGRAFYDQELVRYLKQHAAGALVALDAPLVPSVCMRCTLEECPGFLCCREPVVSWFQARARERRGGNTSPKPLYTPYTQRACEVYMRERYGLLPRETLGQGMGPLTARAQFLRRRLANDCRINENLIEVFPKATIHALFGATAAKRYKREVNTWATRARIFEALAHELHFEVWREGCLKNDHCFDALICAYTGYLWAKEGWQLPEEYREIYLEDGWIWAPPLRDPVPRP